MPVRPKPCGRRASRQKVVLGLGIEEIFAHFVSGLILSFERQIRVGDVVTVDDITGV